MSVRQTPTSNKMDKMCTGRSSIAARKDQKDAFSAELCF